MATRETENYWILNDNTLIFKSEFNKFLDNYINIISKYNKLIFSNYSDIDICIETNNEYGLKYYFESKFNQPVINLPPNITHLTFGYYFNQEVNNLPSNITHLTFDWEFNQKVNNLPPNITHLTFGYHFNQKVDIPFSVKYLKLDCNNQNIIDYLPNSIEELELDFNFNLELNNLPSSIKKLTFDKNSLYNKELNCLPKKLELLKLPENYKQEIKIIPNGLKKIICSEDYKYINNFKSLEIETYE